MNPIHAKLKIYTFSITALSAVSIILRMLCLLFAYDSDVHYFSFHSPLPTIADAVTLLSILWIFSALIFIPKGTMRPIFPDLSVGSTFSVTFCGFIFLFMGIKDLFVCLQSGFMPTSALTTASALTYRRDLILFSLSIATAILSAFYFFTMLGSKRLSAGWHILLGFFPIIWAVVTLAEIYFDFTHAMNAPTKVSLLLALIAIMLFFLQELRMLLDRHQPRLAFVFTGAALLLGGIGGVGSLLAYPAMQAELADYRDICIAIAVLWLYILFRFFDLLRAQLAPEPAAEESEPDA